MAGVGKMSNVKRSKMMRGLSVTNTFMKPVRAYENVVLFESENKGVHIPWFTENCIRKHHGIKLDEYNRNQI
jgi:hypothetical protein